MNYYTRTLLEPDDGPWPHYAPVAGPLEKTAMDWEIFPDGLGHFLRHAATYAPDLPIYVTENGMASYDTVQHGSVDDPKRSEFLDAHLDQVRDAIADGIDVRGYFVWSLMDNYEWALGYDKRFGLVHVDFDTLARTPKASYHALKDALAR